MIKDGVLEEGPCGPKVDSIYGIHLWSYENLGMYVYIIYIFKSWKVTHFI